MKKEFWAEFDLYGKVAPYGSQISKLLQEEQEARRVNKKSKEKEKRKKREELQSRVQKVVSSFIFQGELETSEIPDAASRQIFLAQLLAADVICEGRSTQCKDYAKGKNCLQWWYYAGDLSHPRGNFQEFLYRRLRWMASILNFDVGEDVVPPSLPNLSIFPPGSWAIQISFTLRKPYISRDDTDFYIIGNPVKKEWVFKVPYVAPSQWKGALRAAMVRELVEWWQSQDKKDSKEFANRRFRMALLFGDEKGEESGSIKGLAKYLDEVGGDEAARLFREKVRKYFDIPEDKPMPHFQGHLHFYPTFFDKIGLEVINPHDRETGASVKGPIYFECVPQGTKGTFTLLYVPSYLSDKPEEAQNQAKRDLKTVLRGLYAMFKRYGFGAKTSSGYGVVKDATCKVLKN